MVRSLAVDRPGDEDHLAACARWAERYRRAWETADADEIADLFTPDAADGRCQELWEYWQVRAGRQDPPPGWGS